MTDPTMALRALLEKSSDTDLLREMIGFTAQRLMDLEAESLTGAPYGQRCDERVNQRNGFRDRSWETRAGTIELRIPSVMPVTRSSAMLSARTTCSGAAIDGFLACAKRFRNGSVSLCFRHRLDAEARH